jgi:formylglycine-generating enzyme required for sulfatase activity
MNRGSARGRSLGIAALAFLLAAPAVAGRVDYEMVTVGDPGNGNDIPRFEGNDASFGGVDYIYQIGKYDVTISQYTAFLNAVDPTGTNPNDLYNPAMATDLTIAGISLNSAAANGSKYAVIGPFGEAGGQSGADRPVTYVSWFDAARFANWMTNGQGNGSTETGAYDLTNAPPGVAPGKTSGATYSIPTENEWYKAAYYSPSYGGPGVPGYFIYATQNDLAPGNQIGNMANQANYVTSNGYSVTQAGYSSSQNFLTDVGIYTNSASFYGTFDQSGNVYQWNDLDGVAGTPRGLRGGDWADGEDPFVLSSSCFVHLDPEFSNGSLYGFRLAGPAPVAVPEIAPNSFGSAFALLIGSLGWMERRSRRVFGLVTAT